jgi:hypothetical protein
MFIADTALPFDTNPFPLPSLPHGAETNRTNTVVARP